MRIAQNYSTQNFKRVDYEYTCHLGQKLVVDKLPELQQLAGNKYDIRFQYICDNYTDKKWLGVNVNYLNRNRNFLQNILKPFFPDGHAKFLIFEHNEVYNFDLVAAVKQVITNMEKPKS